LLTELPLVIHPLVVGSGDRLFHELDAPHRGTTLSRPHVPGVDHQFEMQQPGPTTGTPGTGRAQVGRSREGILLADRFDARPLVATARRELRLLGLRPRRTSTTGRDSLTASEPRVADLAADGATNREIAQALFVTTRRGQWKRISPTPIGSYRSTSAASLRLRWRVRANRVRERTRQSANDNRPRPHEAAEGGEVDVDTATASSMSCRLTARVPVSSDHAGGAGRFLSRG
jgi:hypothetical protein